MCWNGSPAGAPTYRKTLIIARHPANLTVDPMANGAIVEEKLRARTTASFVCTGYAHGNGEHATRPHRSYTRGACAHTEWPADGLSYFAQ